MILRRFSLYTTSRRVGEADYVAKVRKVFMKNKFFFQFVFEKFEMLNSKAVRLELICAPTKRIVQSTRFNNSIP